jgi:DNA-binding response OmpR family regulator
MAFQKPRILCADDDADSCDLLRHLLDCNEESYDLTTASSGAEVFDLISVQSFDLFILDYRFVETDGVELCRQIRRTDSETPVLFFTGMARSVDRAAAMAAGANEYLVKPNDLERLTATVERLLRKEAAAAIGV